MLKAYKTELRPTNKQMGLFRQCAGASRYVYNWGLAEWKRQYEAEEKSSAHGLCKLFNSQKGNLCPWIRNLPYAIVESSFINLGNAFKHFFRRVKTGEKPGYPKFKKRGLHSSFQLRGYKTEDDSIWLGRTIGSVRLKERGYIPSGVSYKNNGGVYATISEKAGHWFISVLVDEPDLEPIKGNGSIGVDVGVKSLAIASDGSEFEATKALYKYERKLARVQRDLSRKQKGSVNRKKAKARVARLHKKVTDIRKHAQHQASHHIVEHLRPSVIILEDLNVKGMVKNRRLAKAISDAGMSELHRQIGYKAEWRGIRVIKADRWYASSKTCSNCGCVKSDLTLGDRTFVCPECGFTIDRDLNAARNLAALDKTTRQTDGVMPAELECSEALL